MVQCKWWCDLKNGLHSNFYRLLMDLDARSLLNNSMEVPKMTHERSLFSMEKHVTIKYL
uniref:Uncharacterized protein n=1 Tax=Anguilla anguilla TaxID=7936 RepID=A0A0E9RJU8_ANGAN